MQIPLVDLKSQYAAIKDQIDAAVAATFESQWFILGPEVQKLEEDVARYSGCEFGVGVSSGTDALLIAMMCEGIGPGDEVITTPFTFFSTAGTISRLGATPVFVDIDPATYNLATDQLAAKVTERTRAIVPVHLFGQLCEMAPVMELARAHDLIVIEDAAQAIGSERDGARACSVGHHGCISFFPTKNLGAAGDGGMVVTRDAERAQQLLRLRNHGMEPKYYHSHVGGNFRLDALQAAVLNVKLKYLDEWSAARQANADRYRRLFAEAGLSQESGEGGLIGLPHTLGGRHIYNQFIIRTGRRDELREHLRTHGVATEIYYPVPLHLQECFVDLGYAAGDLPESEAAARETLALPIYPELTDEQAAYVVDTCAGFFAV